MKMTAHDMPRNYWLKQAEKNGIAYRTFWMREQRGWSSKEAATTPLCHKATRKPSPDSTTYKLKAAGLRPNAVRDFRRNHPDTEMSVDEIIAHLIARRERPTLTDMARAAGLHPDTVKYRMKRSGWSLERALSVPAMTRQQCGQIRARQRWGKKEAKG